MDMPRYPFHISGQHSSTHSMGEVFIMITAFVIHLSYHSEHGDGAIGVLERKITIISSLLGEVS